MAESSVKNSPQNGTENAHQNAAQSGSECAPQNGTQNAAQNADDDLIALIPRLPKVLLHDHLDGGLRPTTVLELAEKVGHPLPASTAESLGEWFYQAADSGTLERYLETFVHTCAVMQTEEGLERVAREAIVDLAADGVLYTEQRWAPEQHQESGLTLEAAVEAVQRGIDAGIAEAAVAGNTIQAGQILCAMRHADRWQEVAELAVAYRDRGVVGFDLAGGEIGFPVTRHADVFPYLNQEEFPRTIHAGEGDGVESIKQAIQVGGAERIGHGVRIVDDIRLGPHEAAHETASDGLRETTSGDDLRRIESDRTCLGRTAQWVLDHQIPLEVAPMSNLQTHAAGATSIADHPITALRDLGFAVTINTDNRLMSRTSMSNEFCLLATEAGWTLNDFFDATITAAWSAFLPFDQRQNLADSIMSIYHHLQGAPQ
ncbi:MAG: adenosine deaminase [Cellulomonadaceae bacterium]|jgi:adenosine deaminase|nr:adenosine deaminase [Cellulomonadaceae bacterium]